MSGQKFIYGRCETDYKRPALLGFLRDWFETVAGSNLFYQHDNNEAFTRASLKRLQLPLPYAGKIFRGIDHSILFLDSHGIIIRIGREMDTDPRKFLHPHILQPVGWIHSEQDKLSVALYPAAHLFNTKHEYTGHENDMMEQLGQSLDKCHFRNEDLYAKNNVGYLQLSEDTHYPVCIDISRRIAEVRLERENKTMLYKSYDALREENHPAYEALKVQFIHHARSPYTQEQCRAAFDFHQPLRHAFFAAWPNADKNEGEPNPLKMQHFWQMARNYVDGGYKIYGQDSLTRSRVVTQTRHSPISWKKSRPYAHP